MNKINNLKISKNFLPKNPEINIFGVNSLRWKPFSENQGGLRKERARKSVVA